METHGRFKDAPWMEKASSTGLSIVGAGGIGSNFLYSAFKTLPLSSITIMDPDTVEEHNIGTQFFNKSDMGKLKVECMENLMEQISNFPTILNTIGRKFDKDWKPLIENTIIVSAVDNMKTRKDIFETFKESNESRYLIDGRLSADLYEVYLIQKDIPKSIEMYENTLFDDGEVSDGPCTFKQTSHFGCLIGARITHVITEILTREVYGGLDDLPFMIQEVGGAFLTNYIPIEK